MNRRYFTLSLISTITLPVIVGCHAKVSVTSGGGRSSSSGNGGGKPPSWMRWKPNSEGDGNLVILTRRPVDSITVCGEEGRSDKHSATENGYDDAFRFSKPGREYDKPCKVVVDGEDYLIADPGGDYNK